MSDGLDQSAAAFKAMRLRQARSTERVASHLDIALDHVNELDKHDSDSHTVALVIFHCAKAIAIALDPRIG